ncbi:MAG TPA: hypothetical protein VJM31_02320 [Vicinamibacterales bacterium]|nr:hypothetical protein [Vicinamibacterales bacterium]
MRLALWILCVVGLSPVGLLAQDRPDFSGTWHMDPARSEAAAQGTPIGPVVLTIRQTPGEVRIETTRNGRTEVVRYLPAEANVVSAGELIGAFRWDSSKLITRIVADINKQAITVEEIRSLDPTGKEMTVEVNLVVEHGYQSGGTGVVRPQNSPNSSKGINVFVRTL